MKTIHILNNLIRCQATIITVVLAFIYSPIRTNAQAAVTTIYPPHTVSPTTTTTYTGTGATGNAGSGLTGNTYTYKFGLGVSGATIDILDSFVANGLNFHYQPTTTFVKFRRVDNASVTGLRKSLRIEQTGGTVSPGGTVSCYPDYNDSLELLYNQRIYNIGIDNVFQNATTTNNINIERIDVIFPFGVKATNNARAGFAVFDWGNSGGHDPFYIAAIKTVDGSYNPTAYFSAVAAAAGNYGSAGTATNYVIMRKNAGEAHLLLMNNSTSQSRDGVFFTFNDLGVANNTVIYGYSIFGPDVVVASAPNLVNYNNSGIFPTGTDLGGGGLDPLAITGLWVNNATNIVLADRVEDLSATLVNDQVKLNWNLQNSGDLKDQVVERSYDGVSFSDILHMPVQSTGNQTALDSRPLNGINYYRLKLVQQDGSVAAYSPINKVDLKTADAPMDVYPNPVKNKLVNINMRALTGPGKLILLNMNGQVIMQQPVTEQATQATVHLPAMITKGAYVLQLIDNTGNKLSERQIIVE